MNYYRGTERRFNSYVGKMKSLFGGRVQKLAVNAGFSCPNRDGSKGYGGCTYCLNEAFNPSYCSSLKPVRQQLYEGIEFHQNRYRRAKSYLAYFQPYSNTYASAAHLKEIYLQALEMDEIAGIVIGTRPDCIDREKLDMIRHIAGEKYVMIEYGIETIYNRALERINRGHTFGEAVDALAMTVEYGIPAGAHFIFGLPGETPEDMINSVEQVSRLPLSSVKFHQLQIFRGTAMEKEFMEKPDDFHLFGLEEYIDFMVRYIERLNPAIVVERIAGETPPRFALQRPWGPRYDVILSKFEKRLLELDTWQGKLYSGSL